jgi:hypothetical protein
MSSSLRLVCLLTGALAGSLPVFAQYFPDVPASAPDSRVITDVAYHQLMEGFPDGQFLPEAPLTRAESVMVLARLLNVAIRGFMVLPGTPVPAGEVLLPDLASDHWMRRAALFLAERGMLPIPPAAAVEPRTPMTREAWSLALYRLMHAGQGAERATVATALEEADLLPKAWPQAWEKPVTRREIARILEQAMYYLTLHAVTEGTVTALETDDRGERWVRLQTPLGEARLCLPLKGILVEGGTDDTIAVGMRIRTLSDAVVTHTARYFRVREVTLLTGEKAT